MSQLSTAFVMKSTKPMQRAKVMKDRQGMRKYGRSVPCQSEMKGVARNMRLVKSAQVYEPS